MMNEILDIIWVLIAGIALAIIFFGGLWLTIKKMVHSKMPALWLISSFFLRVGFTLAGFYFVGSGNPQRFLICLAGFIAGRFIVLHFIKSRSSKNFQIQKEVSHET